MKKLAFWILMAMMGVLIGYQLAHAAPFMVCNPQAGVTHYKLTGPAWLPSTVPAQPDGSLKVDVATALVGSNATTLAACRTDVLWGEQCSSTVPFTFTRPSAPTVPGGVSLTP